MKNFDNDKIDLGLELALTVTAYRVASQKTLKSGSSDNITREQLGILLLLSLQDGLYQTQIANILKKDRPNITRMIDVLETKGYIKREKVENNRRILKVRLTEKGFDEVEKFKPLVERMNVTQYKGMSDEEIALLIKLIRKVRQNIIEEYNLEL